MRIGETWTDIRTRERVEILGVGDTWIRIRKPNGTVTVCKRKWLQRYHYTQPRVVTNPRGDNGGGGEVSRVALALAERAGLRRAM